MRNLPGLRAQSFRLDGLGDRRTPRGSFLNGKVSRTKRTNTLANTISTSKQTSGYAPNLVGRTFEITRTGGFEAAHHLAPKDPSHPYGQLHGHSFHVEIGVSGIVQPGEDWVDDFARIGSELKQVCSRLDHSYLNDIEGLELPTLERICVWIADKLQPALPKLSRVTVSRPSLQESCTLRLQG